MIPVWDIGVSTMKRGEIARFFSIPKYAYGSKGEKKYKSATNLIFEIELIDFAGKINYSILYSSFFSFNKFCF